MGKHRNGKTQENVDRGVWNVGIITQDSENIRCD